jgi:hypothetical protein
MRYDGQDSCVATLKLDVFEAAKACQPPLPCKSSSGDHMQERTKYCCAFGIPIGRVTAGLPSVTWINFLDLLFTSTYLSWDSERPFTTVVCSHFFTPSIRLFKILATFLWQRLSAARNSFATQVWRVHRGNREIPMERIDNAHRLRKEWFEVLCPCCSKVWHQDGGCTCAQSSWRSCCMFGSSFFVKGSAVLMSCRSKTSTTLCIWLA